MAAADPGFAATSNILAEDPAKGMIDQQKDGSIIEEDRPVAPDQFDERFETSKGEIWSYYSYYM